MSTIIDTPEGIAFYRLCVHITRLEVEIRTGMGSRINTLQAAQINYANFGCDGRTRKAMLKQLQALRDQVLSGEVQLCG